MFSRYCSLIPLYSTWWRTACSTRNIGIKEREESKHLSASWMTEIVLKYNISTFGKKNLKQYRGTATGTKIAPPYGILFMVELEEEILKGSGIKALPLVAVHRR